MSALPRPGPAHVAVASPADAVPLIVFDRVALDFGPRRIINDLSFTMKRGEFVCVIGPSGCGKTTLLRLLTGLIKPSGGAVQRGGCAVTGPAHDVAIVFQDYAKALLPWRTVAGNVSLALEAAKIPKAERAVRIQTLLTKVGLAMHADQYPNQLSGGMQQRLQIARCLAQEPADPALLSVSNSSSDNSMSAAATFSSRWATFDVPGIGSITGDRLSSQASASCDADASWSAAMR